MRSMRSLKNTIHNRVASREKTRKTHFGKLFLHTLLQQLSVFNFVIIADYVNLPIHSRQVLSYHTLVDIQNTCFSVFRYPPLFPSRRKLNLYNKNPAVLYIILHISGLRTVLIIDCFFFFLLLLVYFLSFFNSYVFRIIWEFDRENKKTKTRGF